MTNIGQIVGFLAMAVSALIYLQRKRQNILALKLTTDVLWVIHHLLIFSYSAAATTTVAIFREVVFYNYDKKWASSKWWVVGFSTVFVFTALMTWKDAFSIIPALSSILTTVAFGSKKIAVTKLFALLASIGMFVYGIHYNSVAIVANECITQLSIIVSIIICYCRNKKSEKLIKR